MGSLSLHVGTLGSTIPARLLCTSWEAELWFQCGCWSDTTGFWRSITVSLWLWARHSQHSLQSLHAMTLLFTATSILSDAECSEGIHAQCWPGLGLLSTSLDKLHAPDAPDRTPGVAPEWAVSAGQLCPSPGCHRNWWGCVWVSFSPLPEVSSRCSRGAVLCSWQKAGVGPTSWTQGGRKP